MSETEASAGLRDRNNDQDLHDPRPWRITQMDLWDQDFVDAEVEGYVRLDHGGRGEFQFGYVHGWIDYELTKRSGRPAVEWSWEGNDEMDGASGRGWAVVKNEGTLKGVIAFHRGDKSGFSARKIGKARRSQGKKLKIIQVKNPKRS